MGKYDKLDRLVSKYVRKRDTIPTSREVDDEGFILPSNRYGKCITCGKKISYVDGHCGHYISRSYLSTRFDDRNMALQCPSCNIFHYGKPKEFRKALVEKYGEEVVEELERLKNTTLKLSVCDIKDMEQIMREKIKQL